METSRRTVGEYSEIMHVLVVLWREEAACADSGGTKLFALDYLSGPSFSG